MVSVESLMHCEQPLAIMSCCHPSLIQVHGRPDSKPRKFQVIDGGELNVKKLLHVVSKYASHKTAG